MPNILMFHRVSLHNDQQINKFYFQRKMIIEIEYIYKLIDDYLKKGFKFGSIKQSLENKSYFHLSFDDGFREHLTVANLLKKRYKLDYNSVSFSINIANSMNNYYTGMDLIYSILANKQIVKLNHFFETNFELDNIPKIKKYIAILKPEQLKDFSNYFPELHKQLANIFLNKSEIIELSKIFKITSHGITHRYLTQHKKESKKEILQSKLILEDITNTKIDTFCYPEGRNDIELQEYCKDANYKYALSIRNEKNNNFCIGRKIM